MIGVEQTQMIPGGGGNCTAAAVASIFEVPLSDCYPEIPNGGGFQAIAAWTARRFPGLLCCSKLVGGQWIARGSRQWWVDTYPPAEAIDPPFLPIGYWLAGVVSPRGVQQRLSDGSLKPSLHSVVMHGSDVAWDPHPKREMGIGGVYDMTWWVVRDPALL